MATGSALACWVFMRAIGLVYLVAFFSLAVQARGLWGSQGILPIQEAVLEGPTLFRLHASDTMIVGLSLVGAAAALLVFAGVAEGWLLVVCFLIYLSYSLAGQDFLSFQWDSLLLEAGFLALFAARWTTFFDPWTASVPSEAVRWAFLFLLFKLMFLSGLVKLESGDANWRNLTALSYHYWTQPLPNPLAAFFHALPGFVHRASTFMTFVIELAVPFLIFWPRAHFIAGCAFIGLSLLILTTGNFAFFNWLTIALALWLIPDPLWARVLPVKVAPIEITTVQWAAPAVVLAPVFLMSLFWCVRSWLPRETQRWLIPIVRVGYEWRISSPYGLFATMTTTRPEIIIEGSDDGETWKAYAFKYKPGDPKRAPPFVAPHQPRLDWQMWFAALGSYRQSPWLTNFQARLLQGSPDVLALLGENPFPERPPKFIRARIEDFEFAAPREILNDGLWWRRTPRGAFGPELRL